MYNKERKQNNLINLKENTTKCGEQIPSLFAWMTQDEQKKRAEELEYITNKDNKNRPS